MQLTYYAPSDCVLRRKIEGAAKVAGVCINREEIAKADVSGIVFPRYPALLTPTGLVAGSNAAMRYIGEAFPTSELCGCSVSQRALVASTTDAITAEIETPLLAAKCGAPKEKVVADLKAAFGTADAVLKKQTYIAGQRLSLADLALANAIAGCMDGKLFTQAEIAAAFPHLSRHMNTVAGRCEWGVEIPLATPAAAAVPAKKEEKKVAPKKEKEAEEEEEEKKPEAPKVKDPIELLPASDFDMDAWKRKYSNTKDLKGEAMPYLWEKLDTQGYSFWRFRFERVSQDENTQVFKASNCLGMFLQRIDNWLRKYMFAVCNVLPNPAGYFDVEGILLTRGQEIPLKLKDHDQYLSFTWTKLDAEKDKEVIGNWFCEGDMVEGREIADCKVFK